VKHSNFHPSSARQIPSVAALENPHRRRYPGLGIANRDTTNPKTIVVANAIHSAGLSLLSLVLACLAHEAHHYPVKATRPHDETQAILARLRTLQALLHILSAGGMSLIVYYVHSMQRKSPR
jgi:hypothetical protein